MKAKNLFVLLALVAVIASTAIGCDNRSQLEKDADKAMDKIDKKINN